MDTKLPPRSDRQRVAAPSVIGVRFSKILIIESLPAGEAQTGLHLYQTLAPLPSQLNRPVTIEHRPVTSRQDLANALDRAFHEVVSEGHTPLLHFECHGNPEGLELRAAGEFVPWGELSPRLTDLNVATGLKLFVGLSACYGAYLVSQLVPTERAPFIACLSTKRPEYDHDLFVAFKAFYTALLTTLDGDAARAALHSTGLADHFYFGDALYWFKLAYSRYLAEQRSPDEYLKRARRIVKEAGVPTKSLEEIAQHLRDTEREAFAQHKARYFMTDIYPANAERFTVAFEQVDARGG
jgi:hypothetical protein